MFLKQAQELETLYNNFLNEYKLYLVEHVGGIN